MRYAPYVAALLTALLASSCLALPRQGGPGLSDVEASSTLIRRGSGSGSRSPSPHAATGLLGDVVGQPQKRPASSHSTGLLEDSVHQAHARPSSIVHPSYLVPHSQPRQPTPSVQHLAHLHAAHQVHQTQAMTHQTHPMHLSAHPEPPTKASGRRPGRPKKVKPAPPSPPPYPEGGRLGHLVAGILPKGNQKRKRPSKSQVSGGSSTGAPKSAQESGEKPGKARRGPWWARPNSAPPMQYGTSKNYDSQKRYRDKHKSDHGQAEHLDQHPSGHEQHHPKGPGSPSAGSHAGSKRSGGGDGALVPRGSTSRSPSPPGSGDHGAGSTGLLGDIVRQSQRRPAPTGLLDDVVHQGQVRPASQVHPSQAAATHYHSHSSQSLDVHPHTYPSHQSQMAQVHPTQQRQTTQAHPSQQPHASPVIDTRAQTLAAHRIRHGHQFKRLGDLAAGVRPAGAKPSKRPASSAAASDATGSEAAKKKRGPWWSRKNSGPSLPYGTAKDYETQKRYRDKVKLRKEQAKQVDHHLAGHQQHPPKGGGPGSPGAGSHAVS